MSTPAKLTPTALPAKVDVIGAVVKKINCHAGVVVNGMAVSSLHFKDHNCKMSLTPIGVYVSLAADLRRPAAELLVPYANVYFIELMGAANASK